jgi:hypothetical protein
VLIVVQIFPPRSAPAPTAPSYLHMWRQHATVAGCLLPTPLQPPSAPHGARPLHSCAGQSLSGILPGYTCKEGRIVEDGLLVEFPCTPTRTRSVYSY